MSEFQLILSPTVQDDWWLCMVAKKSCTKLKMSEFDDTFSDERATPDVSWSTVKSNKSAKFLQQDSL